MEMMRSFDGVCVCTNTRITLYMGYLGVKCTQAKVKLSYSQIHMIDFLKCKDDRQECIHSQVTDTFQPMIGKPIIRG